MNDKTQHVEQRKPEVVKSRALLVISILVIVALAAYNVWLMRPLRVAVQEVKDLKAVLNAQTDLLGQVPELLSHFKERVSDLKAESKPIMSRLEHARELDDLRGIAGEKIVSFSRYEKDGQKFYFYVPAGNHRLAYCQHVLEGTNSVRLGNGELDRRNVELEMINLKSETRYEIRFSKPSDAGKPSFHLIGPAGTIAKESLEFPAQPKKIRVRAKQRCFPNQLSNRITFDHSRGYPAAINEVIENRSPRIPVEIAVVRCEYPDQRAVARFFVDSDARVNVPAEALLHLMYLQDPGELSTRLESFEQYDGSGRYYFNGVGK